MSDLKPCPFCPDGGEMIFKDGYQDEEGSWHSGYVRCEKCGTMKMSVGLSDFLGTYRHGFVSDETAHECSLTAIERWNTRHEPQTDFLKEVYDWAFAGMEGCDGDEWELFTAILDAITRYRVKAGLLKIETYEAKDSPEALDLDDIWR